MHKARYFGQTIGMSAIEQACWDILGKSLGVPMWKLFGGKHHERLRVYANGWYQGPRDPAFFAEKAASMVEQGYTAFKFDPFGGAYQQIGRRAKISPSRSCAPCATRSARTSTCCIEAHDRFTVGTAIRIGRRLEEFAPMWLETPVRTYDLAGHLEVARADQGAGGAG